MDRRNFLRALMGVVAAPAVTYVLPPIGGWRNINGVYRTGLVGDTAYFEFHDAQAIENFKIGPGMLHIGNNIHIPIQSLTMESKVKEIKSAYRGATRAYYPGIGILKGSFKWSEASPEAIKKLVDTANYFQ